MDVQAFLDNFATIAEAPGGVQRLRDLVVDLAVEGRLLPDSQGMPRELARIGEVVDLISGQHLKPEEYNQDGDGLPYLTGPADFTENGPVATRWTHERRAVAIRGDVLLTVKGAGIGKLCVLDAPEAAISRQLMAVRPTQIHGGYLRLALIALRHRLRGAQVGIAIPGIGRTDVLDCPIARPTIEEQEQIVAKVDDLMGLCDDLEARHERRHRATAQLRGSALHALTESGTPEDLRQAWERLDGNWPSVTDGPGSVPDLRQAILRLAVEGQLVQQSPATEEPAGRLLEQLAERRGVAGSPLPPGERPDLPAGWAWASFGQATINRDAERVPLKRADRSQRPGQYDYYGASGVIDQIDDYIFDGDLLLIGEDGANLVLRSTPIAFIASGRFWVNNHAHVLESVELAALRYLAIFINSINLRPYLTGIAQPKLNQARMNRIAVPLPPLAEQRRIVERVDQLLGMCDDLRHSLTGQESSRFDLAAAACHSIVSHD